MLIGRQKKAEGIEKVDFSTMWIFSCGIQKTYYVCFKSLEGHT